MGRRWTELRSRLADDRNGAVALVFALLLLPLIGAITLAIDFGNVMTLRAKAQMAADAASLQATGVTRDLMLNSIDTDLGRAAAIADGRTRGEKLFKAHVDQLSVKDYTVSVSVALTGRNIRSDVAFSVVSPNILSKVFGHESFRASGVATSTGSLPDYTDAYLALDVSPSMGIAATEAEMIRLFNVKTKFKKGDTKNTGCVFGCHTQHTGLTVDIPVKTTAAIATENNIRLRIDVLRDAVTEAIDSAYSAQEKKNYFRISLSKMGTNVLKEMNEFQTLTNNATTLRLAAATIDMSDGKAGGAPGTHVSYFNDSLTTFANRIPAGGDGLSQQTSKKFAVIVTDGVISRVGNGTSGCKQYYNKDHNNYYCTIDSNICTTMKNKGVKIAVLYTTYFPIYQNPANKSGAYDGDYNNALGLTGVQTKIAPALQACASPGWFYEASDADGIHDALNKIFGLVSSAPYITN